ncbi:uncharacterized protein METZ01_LOCUS207775 [marine metagenome]|uniref:Uncharacterized protein n=1 Tax=marine metagenome TaxID=408172 RepID=A0A382EYE7_9ZZZZ
MYSYVLFIFRVGEPSTSLSSIYQPNSYV